MTAQIKRVNVSLPEALHARLKRYAEANGQKLSFLVEACVEGFLEEKAAAKRGAREAQAPR